MCALSFILWILISNFLLFSLRFSSVQVQKEDLGRIHHQLSKDHFDELSNAEVMDGDSCTHAIEEAFTPGEVLVLQRTLRDPHVQ